jgi:phospholipid transport system substrate-binding protein
MRDSLTLTLAGLLACLLALVAPGRALAEDPTVELKASIDRVLQILQDPKLAGEAKAAQRRSAMIKAAEEIYDFDEMAQRALGQHWRPLSDKQRKEFSRLFAQLVEWSYMAKVELYGGEPVRYVGTHVEGDLASVATRIVTKNGNEVPIDYRLHLRGGRWYVYDVTIEGVSLVNNYRTQFNAIIRTSSFDELVKKMKTRIEELRKPA